MDMCEIGAVSSLDSQCMSPGAYYPRSAIAVVWHPDEPAADTCGYLTCRAGVSPLRYVSVDRILLRARCVGSAEMEDVVVCEVGGE